jgi:hypothetical protein
MGRAIIIFNMYNTGRIDKDISWKNMFISLWQLTKDGSLKQSQLDKFSKGNLTQEALKQAKELTGNCMLKSGI